MKPDNCSLMCIEFQNLSLYDSTWTSVSSIAEWPVSMDIVNTNPNRMNRNTHWKGDCILSW